MHNLSVVPMDRTLGALSGVLGKARAHCEARKIDEAAFLTARLFPDMLPFTRQVQLACDFAARTAARLAGAEVPSFPDTETSFAALQDRIAAARAAMAAHDPAAFAGAEGRQITLRTRQGEMVLDGLGFLTQFANPNFFFHATTAYNILRHGGVEIGKADFMG
jgi:hypothetical protein